MKRIINLLMCLVVISITFFGCSASKEVVGKYTLISVDSDTVVTDHMNNALNVLNMFNGKNITMTLNEDGTGTWGMGDIQLVKFKYTGSKIIMTEGDETVKLDYTYNNGTLTIKNSGTRLVFQKNGTESNIPELNNGNGTSSGSSNSNSQSDKEVTDPYKNYDKYTYKELTFMLPKNEVVQREEMENYDFVYDNNSIAVFGIQESKNNLVDLGYGNLSLQEYADILIQLYDISLISKDVQKDYVLFSYQVGTEPDDYFYTIGVYENNNDFWIVNFACAVSNRAKYENQFKEWVKLVKC